MDKVKAFFILLALMLSFIACDKRKPFIVVKDPDKTVDKDSCGHLNFHYEKQEGCDGQIYPDPSTSEYILPFRKGESYLTGLTNCSSSYHAPDKPDRYAFDFNLSEGNEFIAARGGVVAKVVEDQSSEGGGAGNYLVINHLDGTYAYYLHSPKKGIYVKKGQTVQQGDVLGIVGRSGLAGYPHLHFIVVKGSYAWPYHSIPITFRNTLPADVIIKEHTLYMACNQ